MTKDFYHVAASSAPYNVYFFYNENPCDILREQLKVLLENHSKIAIITDDNIKNIYSKELAEQTKYFSEKIAIFSVEAGEKSKNRDNKEKIEDFLFSHRFDRKSAIIALGGGVIGDLTGFVAATYMRGIDFYQMPTSLLSMSDSSIGGKNGVNTPFGKNLIGTLHQPRAVFTVSSFLKTLPKEEMINGVAEAIKFAIIFDLELFNFMEKNAQKFFTLNTDVLQKIIKKNVSLKGNVIEKDEYEIGLRKSLNFGHTVGHALERLSGYRIKHGLAIAWGMVIETYLSVHLGFSKQDDLVAVKKMLEQYRLPTTVKDLQDILPEKNFEITGKILYETMLLDKKSKSNEVHMTMLEKIGKLKDFDNHYVCGVEKNIFIDFFDKIKS